MIKISVITINYNDQKGLEKTISSVFSQNFDEFEFIVIDGGSKDGSKELIIENSGKIDYWISESDTGVYNAMNKGIKVAKGEFIIFMNSGDTFCNEYVLSQVNSYLTPEFDIYYGDNYKIKPNSKSLKKYPEKLSFSFFYSSSLNHQSTFIRRQLFFDHFLYSENFKIISDWEFFIYTICKMNVPYKYLSIPIANYDFTGISSLDKYKNLAKEERIQVLKKYFPLFVEDYVEVSELNSKRFQQIFHIKKFSFAWKLTRYFISIVLLFLPKFNRK